MGFASLFAQKSEINRRQLMADSIAKRVTFDYNADTLYSEFTQEIDRVFRNVKQGKENGKNPTFIAARTHKGKLYTFI